MSEEWSIEISGIEETCAMLDAAPREIARNAFPRALAAAAVPVVEELRLRTPIAEYPAGMFADPGSLEAHIITDIALDANGNGGFASIGFGKYGSVANFVEYGHEMVAHGATWTDRKQGYAGMVLGDAVPPHPFMRPAAAAAAEAAVDAFAASVRATLDKGIPGIPTEKGAA